MKFAIVNSIPVYDRRPSEGELAAVEVFYDHDSAKRRAAQLRKKGFKAKSSSGNSCNGLNVSLTLFIVVARKVEAQPQQEVAS